MQGNTKISIYEGVGKESKKPFKAVRIEVGRWSTLVFPSTIEMDYVERILSEDAAKDSALNLND